MADAGKMNQTKRYTEVDIARGIGILFVVLGHSIKQTGVSAGWIRILTYMIYSFHMPLFFMMSGYCFKEKYSLEKHMESFDYISGKDSGYLKGLCNEAEVMLNKFNTIVELSVSVDDEVLSYDTREMDDMIEALEELKKSGKNKLAR